MDVADLGASVAIDLRDSLVEKEQPGSELVSRPQGDRNTKRDADAPLSAYVHRAATRVQLNAMRLLIAAMMLAVLALAGCGSDYATYETDRVAVDHPREQVRERVESTVIAHPRGKDWQRGASIQLRVEPSTPHQYRARVAAARDTVQPGVPFKAQVDGARDTWAVRESGSSTIIYALAHDGRSEALLIATAPEGTELDVEHIVRSLRID